MAAPLAHRQPRELAIGHGVNLLRVVLTARLLKPEDFGLFGISMVVYGGLVVFSEFNHAA